MDTTRPAKSESVRRFSHEEAIPAEHGKSYHWVYSLVE
jgi:hypothetical protein